MTAYYEFLQRTTDDQGQVSSHYRPTLSTQGAWNDHEQHMAPASGLLAAEIESFAPRDDMRIARISYDIFGVIHREDCVVHTRIIRPGRTIELIESELQARGRTCVVARAWRMLTQDSSAVAGLEDQPVPGPEQLADWTGLQRWPGGYVRSIFGRQAPNHQPGNGIVWVSNDLDLVQGQPTSDFAHLMGMVDTANGAAPRQADNFDWAFPNLDLQVHMYRQPRGRWLGLQTVQQYGSDGIGLTSSILHDETGPFGRSEQILTLRPMSP